jgi:hypothetical protein
MARIRYFLSEGYVKFAGASPRFSPVCRLTPIPGPVAQMARPKDGSRIDQQFPETAASAAGILIAPVLRVEFKTWPRSSDG